MGYGYGPAPGNTQAMGGAYGPSGSYPASSATKSPSIYYSGRPTLVPQPNFDPGQDADELRKAMRGMGKLTTGLHLDILVLISLHQ